MKPSHDVAIVGVGETRVGVIPDRTSMQLHAEAAKRAIDDAGLSKGEIDGVLTAGSFLQNYLMHAAVFSEYMGITPRYCATVQIGGAGPCHMLIEAAAAIRMGQCHTVLVVSADPLYSHGRDKSVELMAGFANPEFELPFGFITPTMYALTAQRHMHQYGTTREQLAQVAVSMRKHASLNPNAHFRTPITIEDVMASKMISSPLRLLDCSPVSDGGGAFIVTSAERARDLRKKPVYVLGAGEGHTLGYLDRRRDVTVSGAVWSGKKAYETSGLGPGDMDFAQIYDCFTITLIVLLEDLGFCKKGEGGAFVEGGSRIELGGEIPVNTHGGLLSHGHPGAPAGIFHIIEGVRQLRREVEPERQVRDAKMGLLHGNGGMLRNEATVIIGID